MKVRVYDMNGTKAVNIPADIMELLGWDDCEEVEMTLVRKSQAVPWVVELTKGRR